MNNPVPPVQRSWTAEAEGGSGKWLPLTILSLLLIAAVYFFITNVIWRDAPQTFVVAVTIPQYDSQILPEPAFAAWDVQSTVGNFAQNGLEPWEIVGVRQLTTEVEIQGSWKSLDRELADKDVNNRDTVIVYLRGHAIVYDEKAYLLAGEFTHSDLLLKSKAKDSETLPNAASLTSILTDLQSLPAGNIIVLADICDMPSVPKLGVIANDVPTKIKESLAQLDSQKPLWVIAAAESLQPGHSSYKRKRTLLQSACEYACDASSSGGNESFLSLASFYESILRYSDYVTQSTQTPILLRSGESAALTDESSRPVWREAEQVRIANLAARQAVDANGDAPSNNDASGEENISDAAPATTNTAAGDESDSEETSLETREATASLQFWKLHESLTDRTANPGGWSPLDFAVQGWRRHERDIAALDRLQRLGQLQDSRQLGQVLREIEQLEQLMRPQSGAPPRPDSISIAARWLELQRQLADDESKLAWEQPNVLEQSLSEQWTPIRQNYRVYIDAMGRIGSWLEFALHQNESDRSQLLTLIGNLSSTLSDIASSLPDQQATSVINSPLPPSTIENLRTQSAAIDAFIAERTTELLGAIAVAQLPSGSKLTWEDERQISQILSNPNLPFALRKKLSNDFDTLTAQHIIEPGTTGKDVDKSISMTSLLSSPGTNGTVEFLNTWSAELRQLFTSFDASVPRSQGGSTGTLNDWGMELITSLQESVPSGSIHAWQRSCLTDIVGIGNSSQDSAGILLAVSDDLQLNVALADVTNDSLQLPNPPRPGILRLNVSHRNGASAKECWLRWESPNPVSRGDDQLQVNLRGGRQLEPETPHRVSVVDGQIQLELRAIRSRQQDAGFSAGKQLLVTISPDSSGAGISRQIQLLPPNPDRVDLAARQVFPDGRFSDILFSAKTDDGWVLKQLSAPAIGNDSAKAQYELNLVNRADSNKHVVVRIYDVQGFPNAARNGRITKDAINLTLGKIARLKPIFQSPGPIALDQTPPGTIATSSTTKLPNNSAPLVLSVPTGSAPGSQPTASSFGQLGLLCLIDEVAVGEADTPPRMLGKQWAHWIECVPENPTDNLVDIAPQNVSDEFRFQVSVEQDQWDRWQIEELVVTSHVTDAVGTTIASTGRTTAILTKDEPVQSLSLRPERKPVAGEKLYTHITVGEFPRAIAFESRLRGPTQGTNVAGTSVAIQPFIWLDENDIACNTPGAESTGLNFWLGSSAFVVPSRIGVSEKTTGQPTNFSSITAPVRVDFPRGSSAVASFSLGNTKADLRVDRKFLPSFEIVGGNLVFSAAVSDFFHEFKIPSELRGLHKLEVLVKSQFNDVRDSAALVFDRLEPKLSRITTARELYLEESVELVLEQSGSQTLDTDTPLDHVYFAIDRGGFGRPEFDESDKLLDLEVVSSGVKHVAILKAEQLAQMPRGDIQIVARTVDIAGNVQDKNVPATLFWNPTKRPIDAPPKKTTPPVIKPPVAQKHTVRVKVTLAGKSLTGAQLRNTELTGISGAVTKKYAGGTWIITLVAEGPYQLKAAVSDNGTKFEGNASITVSPSSGKAVSVDMKPAD